MVARWRIALTLAAAALSLALVAGSPAAVRLSGPCTGSMLSATFKVEVGSAGAGNIVYRLTVRNSSHGTCFVTGIPSLTLLGKSGKPLPTNAVYGGPKGALSAVMVTLAPGGTARLSARFSPDVPGTGEPQTAACEKTAFKLRVRPSGGGTTTAPITPATPVCEHGSMSLTVFTR